MRRWLGRLLGSVWMLGLGVGALIIAWASRVYFDADELAPFVIEKLPLPHEVLWLAALKAHVVAASFTLPACLLLSLKRMLRFPRAHRWLGRVTGAVVLSALVPSGLYLSLFAKGGVPATVGFALSGLIVAFAMVQGVRRARAKVGFVEVRISRRPHRRNSHEPKVPAPGPAPLRASPADRPQGFGHAA